MQERPKQPETTEQLLKEVQTLLNNFEAYLAGDYDVRCRVIALAPAYDALRSVGISLVPGQMRSSARERILQYMLRYPETVLDRTELAVVAGIEEWAGRIRELRVQFGWDILTGVTIKELAEDSPEEMAGLKEVLGVDPSLLKTDQYVLLSTEQDRDAAFRWRTLNDLRKRQGGVKSKIIDYLRMNVGRAVTGEELKYLARDASEWARRVRELRTEEGWPVVTRQTGRPDLPVGVYLLERDEQAEPHDRQIKDDVRVAVLTRDSFRCQYEGCGWTQSEARPDDPRRNVELHHIQHHRHGGSNTADNLITLCNVHHDVVHRDREHRLA